MSTATELNNATANTNAVKYVYFFGDGHAEGHGKMKDELGGKGAGLAEMTNAGLPVPPGFTIQTEACREYMRNNSVSKEVNRQMDEALRRLESLQGQDVYKRQMIGHQHVEYCAGTRHPLAGHGAEPKRRAKSRAEEG